MIKHFCDKCGTEIDTPSGIERIYFRSHRVEYSAELCTTCWECICLEVIPRLGALINQAEAKAAAKKAEKLKPKEKEDG